MTKKIPEFIKPITGKAISAKARAASLTPERRKEIATNASHARYENPTLRATHGNKDKPLIIGNMEIPCFVLSDGKRVLIQRNMANAIGLADSKGGHRITRFTSGKSLSEFIDPSLINKIDNPIKFKTPQGKVAYGYDASILIDICEAVLKARDNDKLIKQQEHIAIQCEVLIRSVAKVGIIALVDEATGYQEERSKTELSEILQKFITNELQNWVHTFPLNFYKELYRIRGLEFGKEKMPSYFGHLTNNIIYKRLAPEILIHLKSLTPKSKAGNTTARYFQSLSSDMGYHRLKEHLGSVVTLMKLSETYEDFENKLNVIHPIFEEV